MTDNTQLSKLMAQNNGNIIDGDWSAKPAIPASTVAVTNTTDNTAWVEITGGTVTVVKVDNVTIGTRIAGMFLVRPGSTISMTYSVAPTWQWFPQNC